MMLALVPDPSIVDDRRRQDNAGRIVWSACESASAENFYLALSPSYDGRDSRGFRDALACLPTAIACR